MTEPTVAALVPFDAPSSSVVAPVAPLVEIEQAFAGYQALCHRLLEPADFQRIGDKEFRKKSAWRKLALAFGVSCTYVERTYERDEANRIIRAEVVVRATAPNGRFMDGLGACDIKEKCCPPGCSKGGRHRHCPANCTGAQHFSNPSHDLPATAATRATNRACSDLFGMGEVSAEELIDRGPPSGVDRETGEVYQVGPGHRTEPVVARQVVQEDRQAEREARAWASEDALAVVTPSLLALEASEDKRKFNAWRRWLNEQGLAQEAVRWSVTDVQRVAEELQARDLWVDPR